MEIVRLRSIYQNMEKKNKELLSKLDELTKKNNVLSKENISLKYSHKEPQKQLINSNSQVDKNKIIDELNKKILKIISEKTELEKNNKKLKNINNELIKEKNDLENKNSKLLKDIEIIKEMSEIKENYREKYQKTETELTKEKQKNKNLEKRYEDIFNINNNINNENILLLEDPKTRTYRKIQLNTINEIEMDGLAKISHQSPQCTHKSISQFSTNNTSNTKKIYNNLDDNEISPDNYKIVKLLKLNNLKWFLLKKIKKNILTETEGIQPLYRRYQYLKLNSKRRKEKEKLNEDSYSDYIWKANKDQKDLINFDINLDNLEQDKDILDNEKDKKITELEICIKDLKEKLSKKESDYNRINLNYAKLVKKSKRPEMTYDKLLDENEKIKQENKLLNKKLDKIKENQNFIGISFIVDDLEGSKFIDDNIFENLLEEITKNREDKKAQEIITMKCFISNEDNKNKENKIQEYNSIDNNKYQKEEKEKICENINNDLKDNSNNNCKIKKIIKKEYVKDILPETKKDNEMKIGKEENKSLTNRKIAGGDNYLYDKIKSNLYCRRYHKSIQNTRNINTVTYIQGDNINLRESTYKKEKSNQKSFNIDSSFKNNEKEKVKNNSKEKEKPHQKRIRYFRRVQYSK